MLGFTLYRAKVYSLIGVLGILCIISACSLPQDIVDSTEIKNIKGFIANSCPLNQEVDVNQDIIVATLYYNENEFNIGKKEEAILEQVVQLFNICNNRLFILAHNSNKEVHNNLTLSNQIAYLRAEQVINYLNKSIPQNYLHFSFCGNLRNQFLETNPNAVLGNQRVEIIMITHELNNILDYLTSGNL